VAVGLLAFAVPIPALCAEIHPADALVAQVRAGLWEAGEVFKVDAASGRAKLDELAERNRTHLATSLLEYASSLTPETGPDEDPLGGVQHLQEQFIRSASSSLADYENRTEVKRQLELYLSESVSESYRRSRAWKILEGGRLDEAGDRKQDKAYLMELAQAIELLEELEDGLGLSRAFQTRGGEYLRRGRAGEAAEDFEAAAVSAIEAGDRWFEARARVFQGRAHLENARPDSAFVSFEQAAQKAAEVPDVLWEAEALRGSGRALLALENPLAALNRFVTASDLLFSSGQDESWRAARAEAAGACEVAAGNSLMVSDLERAQELIDRGLGYADEAGERSVRTRLLLRRAELMVGQGKTARAVEQLREVMSIYRSRADDAGMSIVAARLGQLLESDRPELAVGYYREAAEAAAALGDDEGAGRHLAASAEVARRASLTAEAHEGLQAARAMDWETLPLETADKLSLTEGHLALQERRYSDALEAYGRIRGGHEISLQARWGEGVASLRMGEPGVAAARLMEALPSGGIPPRALFAALLSSLEASDRARECDEACAQLRDVLKGRRGDGDLHDPDADALSAMLALRNGDRDSALATAVELAGRTDPRSLYEAAALYSALGESEASGRVLARARRMGLDPVLPALDPLLFR
jgi:tetratricopeptide (TPR) repeat protein